MTKPNKPTIKKPGEFYNGKMLVKLIDGKLYWGDHEMKYVKPKEHQKKGRKK